MLLLQLATVKTLQQDATVAAEAQGGTMHTEHSQAALRVPETATAQQAVACSAKEAQY